MQRNFPGDNNIVVLLIISIFKFFHVYDVTYHLYEKNCNIKIFHAYIGITRHIRIL